MQDLLTNALLNLNSPPVLFFILGFIATVVKSDLNIPEVIAKGLSIYFMIAIGFKGGSELAKTGFTNDVVIAALGSLFLGCLIPVIAFYILKLIIKVDETNAGAIAAHYGSVSVVTFVTAAALLEKEGINYDGFMVGMMALMESPAIFISLLLVRLSGNKEKNDAVAYQPSDIVKESLFNASVILLTGSLIIGYLTGTSGYEMAKPFFVTPFHGILTIFLLDMGMIAGRRISEFKTVGLPLGMFAIVMPIISALLAIVFGSIIDLGFGSTVLLSVLCSSASYIAAPAAVRMALPSANPAYYITMSLAITFPFNIIFGIPIYKWLTEIIHTTL